MSETGKNPEDDFDFEAYDETGDFEYDPDMDMGNVDFDDLPNEEAGMEPLADDDMNVSASDLPNDDDGIYDADMNAAPAAPKKKSSAIFYLVLALVILGGGFFVFSTFMSGPAIPPPTAPMQSDLDMQQQAADNPNGMGMPSLNDMANQQQPADPNAYPSDMAQLPDANGVVVTPDTNGNVAPADMGMGADPMTNNNQFVPNDPAADQLAAQQQALQDMNAQQQDMNAAPMADPLAAADTTTGAPLPVNPDPMPQTNLVTAENIAETDANATIAPPAPSAPQSDAQLNNEILSALNGIQGGISELRQSMNSLEVRVSALENAPAPEAAAPAPAASGNSAEVAVLKGDVKSMESKIASMQEAMATQTAAVKEALALMKKQASAPAPAAVKPTPAPTAKPAATKTVTAPAATQTPSQPTKAASVSWKLQGAQPGKAWLTRTSGGEPVTVTTGAYLPGLGRVNFIGQREGRWMVEGSEGRVSE